MDRNGVHDLCLRPAVRHWLAASMIYLYICDLVESNGELQYPGR